MTTWLLNNCHGRDYFKVYGVKWTFFDLPLNPLYAERAKAVAVGDKCYVFTNGRSGQLDIQTWIVESTNEVACRDTGEPAVYYVGKMIERQEMSKREAAADPVLGKLLTKKYDLKRMAALRAE